MIHRGMLLAGAAALALSAPALAQEDQGQTGQGERGLTVDIVPATQWTYEGLYEGWSADSMVEESDVYNEAGEEIGELEDMVVGPDGKVQSLIIESGGFLDIGDATFAYPADQAQFESRDRIVVPIGADTDVTEYSLFAGRPIEEEAPIEGANWRISQLLNDYAYLGGGVPYGWVRDVIIDREEMRVQAVVVSPDVGYGAPGVYAFPYYDWRGAEGPQAGVYQVPYTAEEIEGLDVFIYPETGEEGMDGTSGSDQG